MQPKMILLDADGVVWRGGSVIPEAPGFIQAARAAGIRTLLVSNNAGPNRSAYLTKCERLGLPFREEDIYSTNYLAGRWLHRHCPGASVLVVGSPMLVESVSSFNPATGAVEFLAGQGVTADAPDPSHLREINRARFDVVLLGMDIRLNYLSMALACSAVQHGARLVGANPDYSFPVEDGIVLPGNGSVVELVTGVTGAEPTFLGKPETHLLDLIEEETGCTRSAMVMIGDRPETDIEFARRGGIDSLLVLTGVTAADAVPAEIDPARVVPDLTAAAQLLGFDH